MTVTATAADASPRQRVKRRDPITWIAKPVVWTVCMAPALWLAWLIFDAVVNSGRGLGANPVEYINLYTGDWALRFLLLSLAVTPVRILTGWKQVVRLRRLIGLFAFFYVILHVSNYVIIDQGLLWIEIWNDIVQRWYITLGMIGLVCLIPLAVTSTKGWMKRLGGRKWNLLHKAVYIAGAAAVIHFFMIRKGFQMEPIVYMGIFAALMAVRLIEPLKRQLAS